MEQRHCRPGGKECSMCGDVGFQKELFRCSSCRQRYQHRYCSSSYPKLPVDPSQWTCDWCVSKHPARGKNQHPGHQEQAAAVVAVDGFKAPGCVRATRTIPSPLDCLLQVAENIEKFSVKKEQGKAGSGPSHNHSEENVRENGKDGRQARDHGRDSTSKAGRPLVHKRKRCSDLDLSKQDHREEQELVKNHHHQQQHSIHRDKLKSPTTPGHSKPPTSTKLSYSHGFQFSPSKAGVGRRYRLLSEIN